MRVFVIITVGAWLAAIGGYVPALPFAIVMTIAAICVAYSIGKNNRRSKLVDDMIAHDFDYHRYDIDNVKKKNLKF